MVAQQCGGNILQPGCNVVGIKQHKRIKITESNNVLLLMERLNKFVSTKSKLGEPDMAYGIIFMPVLKTG
jgi:hypothetical protein